MARRFRFNLEAVLRYREVIEDQKKRDYLDINRQLNEERLKRDELQQDRSAMQDEIVRGFAEQDSFQSIVSNYNQAGRLENAIGDSLRREQQLRAELERRRVAMVQARMDTRMMETLKERRREEFVREQDRVEQALLDELSIQAQGRRVREAKQEADLAEEKRAEAERLAEGAEG